MSLSSDQVAQFKAVIKADILAAQDMTGKTEDQIAALYNAASSPSFWVWRTAVWPPDVMANAAFDWTRVDNLSVGKARIWEWLGMGGTFNPSQANIRAGIDAAWVGTQADLTVRAAVYAQCQRVATRLEKLLATGAGTSVSNGVGPGVAGFEGKISAQNVSDIVNG